MSTLPQQRGPVQGQRAGKRAKDSLGLFPNVWKWKKPGFLNACSDLVKTLPPKARAEADFPNKIGYFEAGSAPLPLRRARHVSGACTPLPASTARRAP